ncbi:hypothetical protein [Mycoplana sp. MJR14]|uniref:hypothetical protein n=1 Tax=Mycoplana sp. MJR14 TaxID=3032583 RepID=UPI000DDAD176|nr:hypothetical protein [Mycoplana sp. MJR14]MDF1633564.1 hypothetical protein [Mycoplana sp. MJR14]
MASGMFSRGKDRTVSETAATIEDQIAELRDQISSLAKLVAQDVADGTESARDRFSMFRRNARQAGSDASDSLEELIASGEEILAELTARYKDTGREVRRTVKDHPFATLGAAALAGFVIAAILRR